ncbi:MAG: hypothetical protein IT348_13360 [Candidatus Eisenbacteria bacterium]|nr:hypothetical protein [Candidatus Eisenbacteria bacterium]
MRMLLRRITALLLASFALAASRSPVHAADWEMTSLPAGYAYTLSMNADGDLFASGGGPLRVSRDDGATWSELGAFMQHSFPRTMVFSPDGNLFASDFALGVFRSADAGLSWSAPLVEEGCDGLGVNSAGVLFAGLTYIGNGHVHRSTDGGSTWEGVPLPGATGGGPTRCFGFSSNGDVYAGSLDGFFRSTDEGSSWQARNSGLSGRVIRSMAVAPNQEIYAVTSFISQLDGLYRSSDRGDSWQRVSPTPWYFSAILGTSDGNLYATEDDRVYRSTDRGVAWTSTSTGISANENLGSLLVTRSGRLLVGGYRVYRTTTAVADVGPAEVEPAGIRLEQNSPNPFPQSTRICFTLTRAARVDLAVFDLTGRRVATLASGALEPRTHAVVFDATGLPAGAYQYRLAVDGVTQIKRMVVVR